MSTTKLLQPRFVTPVGAALLAIAIGSPHTSSAHGVIASLLGQQSVNALQDSGAVSSPSERLVPGQSVSRSISGGEQHSFELSLSGSEYIRFTLDKGDLNLSVTIAAPDGKKIVDDALLPRATETFSIVADQSGVYALTIRSLEKSGYDGRYELRSTEPRMSRPSDVMLLAAQESLQSADRLRSTWKADGLRNAAAKYLEAGSCSRRAGDASGQALAVLGAADVLFYSSENRKALRTYSEALRLGGRARDIRLQIRALTGVSLVLIDLSRFAESLRHSTRARDLSRRIGDQLGLAASLNSIGLQYYSTGVRLKALPVLEEALSLFQQENDRRGQAETLANLGYTRQDLGDPTQALASFQRSLELATEIHDQRLQALDLTAVGLVNSVLGEKQKALEFHNQAKTIFQSIGNRYGEAVAGNGIANVHSDMGNYEESLRVYKDALRLFTEIGEIDFKGLTMGSMGNLYLTMHDPKQALIWCNRRLVSSRLIKERWVEAHTLNDVGRVYDAMGETRKALGYFNLALTQEQKLGDRRGQAYSLNSIGPANEKLGRTPAALAGYKRALALFREVEHGEGVVEALHNIAGAERNSGNLKQAYETARSLIELIETQRTRVAGHEFRTSYFASVHTHYELYIDVLMRMHFQNPSAGYGAAALEASETARARGLLDMLREARADIREGVSPELLQQERELRSTMNFKAASLTSFLSGKSGKDEAAALRKELALLTSEYEFVEARIRAESPRYAALTQPRVMGLADIQKQLDPDTLLLEYSLGKERSDLFAVTRGSIDYYELPAKAKIEAVVREVYDSMASLAGETSRERRGRQRLTNSATRATTTAYNLSKMILSPVAGKLKAKRLAIVADGLLQYFPFSALIDPAQTGSDVGNAQPLAAGHEIVNLPSASVLAELRAAAAGRTPAPTTVAVFADPVFDSQDRRVSPANGGQPPKQQEATRGDSNSILRPGERGNQDGPLYFPRLAHSREEADEISRLVPSSDCRLFLDFAANKTAALDDLMSQFRILHFATHAVLNNAHPELSGIVLSTVDRQGRAQDGFLRLNEIYNMKLRAGLAVLSACETALGKPIEGEGLLGLTRGFMYAGASRVAASLWEVDDEATKELMKHFYEGMLTRHLTAAAALREAQMIMRSQEKWRQPHYWAGFVLQGDWR